MISRTPQSDHSATMWDYTACQDIFPHFLTQDAVETMASLELSRQKFQELIHTYLQALESYWIFALQHHQLHHIFMQHYALKNINYHRTYQQQKSRVSIGKWKLLSLLGMFHSHSISRLVQHLECYASISADGTQLQFSLPLSPFSSKRITISEQLEWLLSSSLVRQQWWNRVRSELWYPFLTLYLPKRCLNDKHLSTPSSIVECPVHIRQMIEHLSCSLSDIALSIREKILEQRMLHSLLIPLHYHLRCITRQILLKHRKTVWQYTVDVMPEHQRDEHDDHILRQMITFLSQSMNAVFVNNASTYECIISTNIDAFVYVRIPIDWSLCLSSPHQTLDMAALLQHIKTVYEHHHERCYDQLWDRLLRYLRQNGYQQGYHNVNATS